MTLNEMWFTEGFVDFELQKYRLLAYLQEVKQFFSETKLYPKLADIIFHYNNLLTFSQNKKLLRSGFPRHIDQINLEKLEIVYEKMLGDDDVMCELERIAQFALGEIKGTIDDGAEIYDRIEQQLVVEPIGIMPLYKNEGYLLLHYQNVSEIRAYSYTLTLFEHETARYRGIQIRYIDTWINTISQPLESIKRAIIRMLPALPNPAVYSVSSTLKVPVDETLLPIAKRVMVKNFL